MKSFLGLSAAIALGLAVGGPALAQSRGGGHGGGAHAGGGGAHAGGGGAHVGGMHTGGSYHGGSYHGGGAYHGNYYHGGYYHGGYYRPYYSGFYGYPYVGLGVGLGYLGGSGAYYAAQPYYGDSVIVNSTPMAAPTTVRMIAPDANAPTTALMHVSVPTPDTRLVVNGATTRQTGTERDFGTPNLEPGRVYRYSFVATWVRNGQELTRKQEIDVRAGQEMSIAIKPDLEVIPPMP